MASAAASLSFGQALYNGLVTTAAVGPAVQAIISPISVWFALILLLNGAGTQQVSLAFGTWRYLQAPTRSSVVTSLTCAGPGTKTQQELWKATAGPSTALSASSATTFNQQASALQKRLNSQAGGSIQLVIANAIWTKDIAVRKSYADEMKASFNVSCSQTQPRVLLGGQSMAARTTPDLQQRGSSCMHCTQQQVRSPC